MRAHLLRLIFVIGKLVQFTAEFIRVCYSVSSPQVDKFNFLAHRAIYLIFKKDFTNIVAFNRLYSCLVKKKTGRQTLSRK